MKQAVGFWLLAALAGPAALPGQGGGPATTSVTLFNSGRVLVRRTLPITLPAGASTQTLALGEFNPVTFTVLDAGVQLVSVKTDQTLSEETLLRRYVGRTLDIDTGTSGLGSRRATLLAMDPERWEWADRPGVMFRRPGRIEWPKDLVPTVKLADVAVQNDHARQNIKVMYETTGSSWAASYRLFLGAQGRLEGAALLGAGTLVLPDAEVQLLSGDIGQGAPPQAQTRFGNLVPRDAVSTLQADRFTQGLAMAQGVSGGTAIEAAGEGHLYTLPERVSFSPGTSVVVPLFEPTPAVAVRQYIVSGAVPYYGGFGQQPDEQDIPVAVSYKLARKLGTPFGDLALPAGYVGVFDLDKSGRVQLVGQGNINHTAPGAEMLVNAGSAFDITAKRVQTDYSTSRTGGVNGAAIRTVAMASYRVALQNAKDSTVVVEVREDRAGEWSVVESSVPADKRSSTRVAFPVTIPAKGTAVLTYRVRVVW
jgi:hypothetical protein